MRKLLGGAIAVLLTAGSVALADPEIGEITTAVRTGDTFIVRVALNTTAPTTVTLNGTINGTPIRQMRARIRNPGQNRRVRFRIGARRYAGSQNTAPVILQAQVDANDASGSATSFGGGAIPVPCAIFPGTGNELSRGAYFPFRNAFNDATGGLWTIRGRKRTMFVNHYFSLSYHTNDTFPLMFHSRGADIKVGNMIRRSMFAKTDIIAHSYGGLLARAWIAQGGEGKARVVCLVSVPNTGAALAFLAHQIVTDPDVRTRRDAIAVAAPVLGGLSPALGNAAEGEGLAGLLLHPVFVETTRLFLPDYPFAQVQGPSGPVPFDIMGAIGLESPLTALNAVPPDPGAEFHAFYYETTPFGGTTETLDVSTFLGTQDFTDIVFVDGAGDGIVAARSACMDDVAGWSNMTCWNLGVGLHSPSSELPGVNGYLNDASMFGIILSLFGLVR